MPLDDDGMPSTPSDMNGLSGDGDAGLTTYTTHAADGDDTTALLDATPRERAATTAKPLNIPRRRPIFSHPETPRGEHDDEWDDASWDDTASDESAVGDQDARSIHHAPLAAPETARLPAIDLEPAPKTAIVPALAEPPVAPVVIPGARRLRRPLKNPFIKRRARPLAVGMLASTIIAALVIAGLVIATPLGATLTASGGNPLVSSVGVANDSDGVEFVWYTAQWGDTPQSLAQKFKVALGGIYELNHLDAGAELAVGFAYKIPLDPTYGKNFTPPTMLTVSANYGTTRFGPNWWNSIAGSPPADSPCAPNGGANLLGYQLQAPNWGARWVRGFIVYGTWVYHTGVDLAAPQGNTIHAAQAGQVIWAGYDATNGLGWSVKIDHCNHVSTVYGHMMRLLVHTGEYVDIGTPVGLEGSTGNSTGPHLHFMVEWNNLWVDPMRFYTSQAAIIGPPAS